MKKSFILLIMILSLASCVQKNSKNPKSELIEATKNKDSGFKIITTNTLITGNATKPYSSKNRKTTQFALNKNSIQEQTKIHLIKISDKEILICESNDKIIKELFVIKKWTEKIGPSTVYDLKDKDGIEYSFDHFVSFDKKNYLVFRFENSLQTYTDANN